MAVRRPLFYDGSDFKEMTAAMVTAIQDRCVYLYGGSPSVTIEISVGSGSLGAMIDTRMQAGAPTQDFSNFDTSGETPNISRATDVTFDKMNQVNASVSTPTDTNNRLYPVYYNSGTIQAMTATDVFDTFITQAIGTLTDGNDRDGTFRISTSTSESGHTLISSNPVFTDTRANTSLYSAGGIPELQDQPFDVNNYYLHRTNQGASPSITLPFQITSGNDLQRYSITAFDAMLLAEIRHHTVNTSGSTISYNINGSGNNRGTGMVDTRLDGSGNYQQRQDGPGGTSGTSYRTQEFPNGSPQTISTYFLKINRS
jgi:hypothetical protein